MAGLAPASAHGTISYFVDPLSGRDSNDGLMHADGTTNSLKTLAHAQSVIRAAIGPALAQGKNITVWLRGGYYTAQSEGSGVSTAPLLQFGRADSGRIFADGTPQTITWQAIANQSPVISGGITLPLPGNTWQSHTLTTSVGSSPIQAWVTNAGTARFRQLYTQQWDSTGTVLLAENKLTRSRYPADTSPNQNATTDLTMVFSRSVGQPTQWMMGSTLSALVPSLPTLENGQTLFSGQTYTPSTGFPEVVIRKSYGIDRLPVTNGGAFFTASFLTLYNDTSGMAATDLEVCARLQSYLAPRATNCSAGPTGPDYYNNNPPNQTGTVNTPFHYENSLSFLVNPGDWYEDFSTGDVYVVGASPPSGSNGVIVVAPQGGLPAIGAAGQNEVLVAIGVPAPGGAACSNEVSNVQYVGITYSHSNWLQPSVAGYVSAGAPNRYVDRTLANLAPMPGAVQLGCTSGVTFSQDRFSQLGGDAVTDYAGATSQYDGATQSITFQDNAFAQVAGDGLDLINGLGRNIQIISNLVADVGRDYGGVGIDVNSGAAVDIIHNDIRYVSSDGITTGNQPAVGTPPSASSIPYWIIQENIIASAGMDMNDVGGIYSVNNWYLPVGQPAGFPSNPVGFTIQSPPWVDIAWNEIDAMPVPNWLGAVSFGYPSPRGIYLDFLSENVEIAENYLTTTVASPFNLNCETHNLVADNNAPLSADYVGGQGGCPLGFPAVTPSTAPFASNNTSLAFTFPTGAPGLDATASTLWTWYINQKYPTTSPHKTSVP